MWHGIFNLCAAPSAGWAYAPLIRLAHQGYKMVSWVSPHPVIQGKSMDDMNTYIADSVLLSH